MHKDRFESQNVFSKSLFLVRVLESRAKASLHKQVNVFWYEICCGFQTRPGVDRYHRVPFFETSIIISLYHKSYCTSVEANDFPCARKRKISTTACR